MDENDSLQLQQEINMNMSVATQQPFAMSNEEQAFSLQQQVRGTFNRSSRRKTDQLKMEQQRDTQDWVNKNANNVVLLANAENSKADNVWTNSVNHGGFNANQQNNRASTESIDTLRENMKNSQESLKRRSCESLTIEEASLRGRSISAGSQGHLDIKTAENNCGTTKRKSDLNRTFSVINNTEEKILCRENESAQSVSKDSATVSVNSKGESGISNQDKSACRNMYTESTDSLNESTCDLSRSYRTLTINDPYTASIDLSNKCRQFYFNHMKAAEAIKQSVRSAKHTRAKEKMEGKTSSGIDNAMDRLRSEMAELMDQDLSLMSQLLKLNDKIEEVKTHVAYRNRQENYNSQSSCYLSNSEISDSEFEDNEDSKLDLSHSPRNFKNKGINQSVNEPETEVVLRRLEPSDSKIIVYKKKKARKGKRRDSKGVINQSRSETDEEDTSDESDENEGGSDSLSDSESTISNNSGSTINGADQPGDSEQSSDVIDSGIQSPNDTKISEEPSKPKKGGISQNRKFLNFHKKNGNFTKSVITGLNVLTMQGHNVPLDKYYVPPGLVYLKQEKSDNVFCQFTK